MSLCAALVRWTVLLGIAIAVLGVWSAWMLFSGGPDPFWPIALPALAGIAIVVATDALWRHHRRFAAAGLFLLMVPTVFVVGALSIHRKDLHWPVDRLYAQAASEGPIPLGSLVEGWDRVCIATPYCLTDLGPKSDPFRDAVCGDFQNDGTGGGIVFLDGGTRSAIQRIPIRGFGDSAWLDTRATGSTCFAASEHPALHAGPARSLMLRAMAR